MSSQQYCKGRWGSVLFAVAKNGTSPAREFFDDCDAEQQTKLSALFKRFADFGEIKNREKFKKVTGNIFEFKSYQVRMLCFLEAGRVILTNGCIKKRDELEQAVIDRAVRIRAEHIEITAPKPLQKAPLQKPRKR